MGFEPLTSRLPVMLYQLSYEATDVGSRSMVGSYVPVKEMSVNDVWNKSYMNCGNEMKMKKSSQWMDLLFRHKSLLFYTFPFPEQEKQHFQSLLIDVQVMT